MGYFQPAARTSQTRTISYPRTFQLLALAGAAAANYLSGNRALDAQEVAKPNPVICFIGTKRGDEKISSFKVGAEKAAAIAKKAIQADRPDDRFIKFECRFIVGDEYVFSYYFELRRDRFRIPGYYVNGMTGRVRYLDGKDRESIYGSLLDQSGTDLPLNLDKKEGYSGERIIISIKR